MPSFPLWPHRVAALLTDSVSTEQSQYLALFSVLAFQPMAGCQEVRWDDELNHLWFRGKEVGCLMLALWSKQHSPAKLLEKSDTEGG